MALRVIWQYMDRSVTKTYYMDRSANYLLYYTFYLK